MKRLMVVLGCMVMGWAMVAQAAPSTVQVEQDAPATPSAPHDLHDAKYCEVLPVVIRGGKLVASVYNTVGLNECPDDVWAAMDVQAIKKQFKAFQVLMNGPRYFLMNEIIPKGATASGESVDIGGLQFTKRAEVVLPLTAMKTLPYTVRDIERDTTYVFKAGEMVYELVDAEGNTYVMQSYSQQVDATLTVDDLPTLGEQLKLPKGWTFQTAIPEQDIRLTADGVAHLVQDELMNSYQRIETTDLSAEATASADIGATATP